MRRWLNTRPKTFHTCKWWTNYSRSNLFLKPERITLAKESSDCTGGIFYLHHLVFRQTLCWKVPLLLQHKHGHAVWWDERMYNPIYLHAWSESHWYCDVWCGMKEFGIMVREAHVNKHTTPTWKAFVGTLNIKQQSYLVE